MSSIAPKGNETSVTQAGEKFRMRQAPFRVYAIDIQEHPKFRRDAGRSMSSMIYPPSFLSNYHRPAVTLRELREHP